MTYLKGDDESLPKQYSIPPNDSLETISSYKDSFITVAVGKHYEHGNFHNFFFGKHYRNLWAQPIQIKVFDIGSVDGKMSINKKGGGFQTMSLRLSNSTNKKYVLRTIDKDESTALPPLLRKTFVKNIFRDQTSALNPFAALIIPPLSEAAGLFHTNPKLYFIPYDPRFGQYAKEFEGRVAIFEEFPDSSWANTENFGFARDILNTENLLKKRYTDQHIKVDSRMLAKARLFDIWIGDWDRHVDQWRWAEFKQEKVKIYKPIARDRDMAFFKMNDSGVLTILGTKINHKLQSFNHDYENLEGLTKNARYIDHVFLSELKESDFIEIADSLKNQMTDKVIEEAIAGWPAPVYAMEGSDIIAKLKNRRNKLTQIASAFYKQLSKEAVVIGTDENESIVVLRTNDETQVQMYDEANKMIYNGKFNNNYTKVLSIFMLGGNDQLTVTGKVQKGIDIELFGGLGADSITDNSEVKGLRKRTKVYDTVSGNSLSLGKEAENKTSNDSCSLDFDRKGVRRK
jgi:hypothetical protein